MKLLTGKANRYIIIKVDKIATKACEFRRHSKKGIAVSFLKDKKFLIGTLIALIITDDIRNHIINSLIQTGIIFLYILIDVLKLILYLYPTS